MFRFVRALHIFVLIAYLSGVTVLFNTVLAFPVKVALAVSPQTHDLAATANWNIRFDGASAGDRFAFGGTSIADIDGDGKNDLAIVAYNASYNGRNRSGSVYIIYNSLLQTFISQTIDLSDPSNYNLRFDGANALSFGLNNGIVSNLVTVGTIDQDTQPDLILAASGDANNSRSNSGSIYVIYGTQLTTYTGTGNNIDLATSSNWNVRFDGAVTSSFLGWYSGRVPIVDLDADGQSDLIIAGPTRRTVSGGETPGEVYVIYDSLLQSWSGTGNAVDLNVTSNFNIRFDGPGGTNSNARLGTNSRNIVTDMNGDSQLDLVLPSSGSGAIYILYHSLFASYSGTGNAVSLASSSNYNIAITGLGSQSVASQNLEVSDIDGDGKPDLFAGTQLAGFNSRGQSGSLYYINGTHFTSLAGTGNNLSVSNSANYNARFDGAAAFDQFGYGIQLGDFFGTGRLDLVTSARLGDNNSRAASGSVYVISNSQIANYNSSGNNVDLATSSNYALRYDGAIAGDELIAPTQLGDLNNDGKLDLLLPAPFGDSNSRPDSGSAYLIYNFPHSVGLSSSPSTTSTAAVSVTGTVLAPNSVTTISNVQYSVDNNSPSGAWTSCNPEDGAYDSLSENFSCAITLASAGSHTINIRAMDSNGSFTAQTSYAAKTITYTVPVAPATITPAESATPTPASSVAITATPASSSSAQATSSPSATTLASPTAETPSPSPLVSSTSDSGPYTTQIIQNEAGETILTNFQIALKDQNRQPLTRTRVTLTSTPQTVVTDALGVARFLDVPIGKHRLTYFGTSNRTVSIPLTLAVKEQLGKVVGVAVHVNPTEVTLPLGLLPFRPFLLLLLLFPAFLFLIWLTIEEVTTRHKAKT